MCFMEIRPSASQPLCQCSGGGKALSTAGGGNFDRAFLARNKRSAQWAVAPIEGADRSSNLLQPTAGGGNFDRAFLARNKRSAQWAVAPIEGADRSSNLLQPTVSGGNFVGGFLNRKGAVFRKLNRRRAPLERVLCLFRLTRSGRLPLALPTGETLPSLPSGELRPLRLRTGVRISYAISHPMDCRRSRNEVSSSAETSSATAPREQCDD